MSSTNDLDVSIQPTPNRLQVHFRKEQYVFHQGSLGDAFYMITKGQALVLRSAEGAQCPVTLATLGQWDSFGERSLVRNEMRYADIKAHLSDLTCLCITREQLGIALGGEPEVLLAERRYEVKADTAEEASTLLTKARKNERKQLQLARRTSEHKATERMHSNSKKDADALKLARARQSQRRHSVKAAALIK